VLAQRIEEALPQLDALDRDIVRACDLQRQKQHYADANYLSLAATKSRLCEQLIRQFGVQFAAAGSVCCQVEPSPAQ
jgi:RNA polymerase sigma-70 factor (ECF subfamily)